MNRGRKCLCPKTWVFLMWIVLSVLPDAKAAGKGEVLVLAPPLLRRAAISVDGNATGNLPQGQRLTLDAGVHQIVISQGRWRLAADVIAIAGVRATVQWLQTGQSKVGYLPTAALVYEAPESAAELRQAAVESLHRSRFAVLGEYGSVSAMVLPAACGESAACLEELTTEHRLRHALATKIGTVEGGFTLEARLFDAESGDMAAQSSEDCTACTLTQARARLFTLCSDVLRRGTQRPLGLLEITSQPTGAEVLVDGRRLGTTPYRRSASSGEHEVILHKTGHIDYQNTVDVAPGRGSALDIVLPADSLPTVPLPSIRQTNERATTNNTG